MNADRCVCCGTYVPEGRQVCPTCERDADAPSLIDRLYPVQPGQEDYLIGAMERVEDALITGLLAVGFVGWAVFCFLVATL